MPKSVPRYVLISQTASRATEMLGQGWKLLAVNIFNALKHRKVTQRKQLYQARDTYAVTGYISAFH